MDSRVVLDVPVTSDDEHNQDLGLEESNKEKPTHLMWVTVAHQKVGKDGQKE